MGKIKKRRNAILEAVGGLFKGAEYRKQLKKARAFEAFIAKLEERRNSLAEELAATPEKKKGLRSALSSQLEILDDQIPKAQKLLVDMQEKERSRTKKGDAQG